MNIDPKDMIVDDGTELPMPDGTQAVADLDFELGHDLQLRIVTELKLLESGVAQDHLTESGLQVGGFNYWVFEDGTKLFYAPGMSVELQHHT